MIFFLFQIEIEGKGGWIIGGGGGGGGGKGYVGPPLKLLGGGLTPSSYAYDKRVKSSEVTLVWLR